MLRYPFARMVMVPTRNQGSGHAEPQCHRAGGDLEAAMDKPTGLAAQPFWWNRAGSTVQLGPPSQAMASPMAAGGPVAARAVVVLPPMQRSPHLSTQGNFVDGKGGGAQGAGAGGTAICGSGSGGCAGLRGGVQPRPGAAGAGHPCGGRARPPLRPPHPGMPARGRPLPLSPLLPAAPTFLVFPSRRSGRLHWEYRLKGNARSNEPKRRIERAFLRAALERPLQGAEVGTGHAAAARRKLHGHAPMLRLQHIARQGPSGGVGAGVRAVRGGMQPAGGQPRGAVQLGGGAVGSGAPPPGARRRG